MCHTVGKRNGHQSVPWRMVLKYPHFLFHSACGFKVWKCVGGGEDCKNVSYGRVTPAERQPLKKVSHWWAKLQNVNHSGLNSQQKCKPWMNTVAEFQSAWSEFSRGGCYHSEFECHILVIFLNSNFWQLISMTGQSRELLCAERPVWTCLDENKPFVWIIILLRILQIPSVRSAKSSRSWNNGECYAKTFVALACLKCPSQPRLFWVYVTYMHVAGLLMCL